MNNKEIGGEFHLKPHSSIYRKEDNLICRLKEFNILFFDSGRSAIKYLLIEVLKTKKKILLPNYLCESIIQAIKNVKIPWDFYEVNEDLSINVDTIEKKISKEVGMIYYINYFGFLQPSITIDRLREYKGYGITIIEDSTHSIFTQEIVVGDYCICSLRKWMALPDGGILYSKKPLPETDLQCNYEFANWRLSGMILKTLYLKRHIWNKEDYLKLLFLGEQCLNSINKPYKISSLSNTIINTTSLNPIIEKRKNNYNYLLYKLRNISQIKALFKEISNCCPIGFPLLTEKREELKGYLINNNVFCPIHWTLPKEVEALGDERMLRLSRNIITIPIDQRYSLEDMDYMADLIVNFLKQN